MTIPFSQVKPASLKMKVLPRYPAAFRAGPGIAITQASGVVTTSVDFANMERDDNTPLDGLYVGAWDATDNLFKLVLANWLKGDKGDQGTPGPANASDYETLAQAEGASIPAPVNYLRIAGFYAAGDGGAALYKRVASLGVGEFGFQSADGAWWKLSEPLLNILMFGAVGDGITVNTTAFNAAMAAFPSSGGTLIIPPGVYLGIFNVTKNVVLQGGGMGNPNNPGGTASCTELRSTGAADNILTFSANGGGARDLCITSSIATGSRTGAGIKIGAVQGIFFSNVISFGHKYGFWNTAPGNGFYHCYGTANQTAGLYLDGSAFDQSEIAVVDSQFNSNVQSGVLIGGNGIGIFTKRMTSANNGLSGVTFLGGSTISDVYFEQPEISGNGLHGIDANNNTGINLGVSGDGVLEVLGGTGNGLTTGSGMGGVNVSGTNITGGTSAVTINIQGADTVITGSQILGTATGGFTVNFAATASNFVVVGNLIKAAGAGFGILVNAGATDGRITGNTVTGFAAGAAIIDNSAVASVVFSNNGGTNITQSHQAAATGAITTSTAFASLFTGTVAVTFAKPFLTTPDVVVSPINGGGAIGASAESITTTGFTARGVGITNGGTFNCHYTASLTTN